MTRRLVRTWLWALATALVAVGAAAPVAGAHSSFLESTPPPGARLAEPPSRIVMVYTEPLNERLTTVRLVDAASGAVMPASVRIVDGRRLEVVPRSRLPQGAYEMKWRSVSTIDAHIREGSVGFGVGTAALGAAVDIGGGPLEGAGPARVLFRWLLYAALFLFAGGALNAALRRPRGSAGSWLLPADPSAGGIDPALGDEVAAGTWRRTVRAAWLALAAGVAVVAVESADATGGLAPGAWADFLTTGTAGFSRSALVAALLLGAVLALRSARAAAAAAAAALLALSLGGHASGAEPRWLAVASNLAHLLAAAIWVGGIAHIAWAWLPALRGRDRALRRAVVRSVLPRFGQVALPAFALVATTGLVNALMQLGHVSELWSSAYGRVLLLKTLLVGVIATVSYLHAFRLRPRILFPKAEAATTERVERTHRRLLGSEALVGLAVLVASAVLVAFPVAPREAREAQASFGSVKACDPCPFAAPVAGELTVAAKAGALTVGAWLRREGREVVGTLRVIDRKRRPARVPASIAGATSTTACGPGCWRFRMPASLDAVEVFVGADGQTKASLPARWKVSGDAQARRLLSRAQREMRNLRGFEMVELVQSAGAEGSGARTDMRFQAPDRTSYQSQSAESIIIGRQVWLNTEALPGWNQVQRLEEPFRVRDGFRWTVFSSTVRLLRMNARTAELAFFDYGYPVWYRLTIDRRTGRALRSRLISPENRILDRYIFPPEPVEIRPPGGG